MTTDLIWSSRSTPCLFFNKKTHLAHRNTPIAGTTAPGTIIFIDCSDSGVQGLAASQGQTVKCKLSFSSLQDSCSSAAKPRCSHLLVASMSAVLDPGVEEKHPAICPGLLLAPPYAMRFFLETKWSTTRPTERHIAGTAAPRTIIFFHCRDSAGKVFGS